MAGKKQENKQRITLLKPREKAAADTGGALDQDIPESALAILAKQTATEFDAKVIVESLGYALGHFRLSEKVASHDMEPADIVKQGYKTAATLLELIAQLEHMNPTVRAMADATLWAATREGTHEIIERIKPDLYRLQAATKMAAGKIEEWPKKTGPKPKHDRDDLILTTYELLLNNSTPRLKAASARALTRELLACCKVSVPEDDRELRKIIASN